MDDPGGGNPFQGLLNDLLKLIGGASAGRTAWLDAARSLAQSVATDGQSEPNADPLTRIAFEELARVAELHVADVTGLPVGPGDHPAVFVPVGPGAWALRVLDAWYARLYGLTRDELRYILDPSDVMGDDYPSETFRVLQKNEMREFGEYRTQRLVLEAWDHIESPRWTRLP